MQNKTLLLLSVFIGCCFFLTQEAAAFRLPDTGIKTCYDDDSVIKCPSEGQPFYGQDGSYQFDDPAYQVDHGNGTVLDLRTGLEWQLLEADVENWQHGKFYCDGLGLGGHSDWRLPQLYELESIVDYRKERPAYDTAYFQFLNSKDYNQEAWSASETSWGDSAWVIQQYRGHPGRTTKSSSYPHARCVRGDAGSGPGPYSTNEIMYRVIDEGTGLQWQKKSAPGQYTWADALEYCESLNLAGFTDFRLPNLRELSSIVDRQNRSPAIDLAFDDTATYSDYWTSTPSDQFRAWAINFRYGDFEDYFATNDHKYSIGNEVRCVRGRSGSSSLFVSITGPGQGQVFIQESGISQVRSVCEISCVKDYGPGTVVILTAVPDEDSTFNGWFGPCGGTETCTLTVDGFVRVQAGFWKKVAAGKGYVPSVIFLLKTQEK